MDVINSSNSVKEMVVYMIQSHQNPDFFPYFLLTFIFPHSDHLAGDLPMFFDVQGKMNGSKAATSEAMRCNRISANLL